MSSKTKRNPFGTVLHAAKGCLVDLVMREELSLWSMALATSAVNEFLKQFFLEHSDAMFLVVATEWLSSFRSCGFMERGENTLAVTGLRRWSSSRMPAAWFTLRPLSSSELVPDSAPSSFPVLQPAAVLYLFLYASLPCP